MTRDPVLRPAPGLELPAQVVTESIGILGQRGAGKSNVAVVLAEEMFDAGLPWVAIDPKGDWWGIRSDEHGTGPGLPIPVFGGLHGDVPIDAEAGALVADLLVDENLTAVLDVSDFTKGERARFLVAFFDRLYRRHRGDPQPRHVFLEEAHEYIPQQMGREDGRLKEAAARIVLQGRTFGLGSSSCSQRSARLHKDVLTQIGTLIAMRTTGPQDRKAIESWVAEHDVGGDLVASLPSLDAGEGWVWSPSFLHVVERFRFRRRRTFDSGSTPVLGKARRVATIADVDTAAIKEQLAETIERAKADDPKELRRRIAVLERELRSSEPQVEIREVEIVREVVPPRLLEALVTASASLRAVADELEQLRVEEAPARAAAPSPPAKLHRTARRRETPARSSDERLGKRERAILQVLAQYPQGRTHRQIALLTGYSPKASTIGAGLATLRKAGYVGDGQPVRATADGVAALGDDLEPLPHGAELLDHWREQLGGRERKLLDVLLEAWPDRVLHDEMAERTGYSPDASTIGAGMSRLRGLEIADGWRLHPDFAEAVGLDG